MGYLLPLLLAFATLFLPELPGVSDVSGTRSGWIATTYLPLLGLVPYGLQYLVRVFERRGRPAAAVRSEKLLVFSPVLLQAAAVLVFGWLETVERWALWSEEGALDVRGWPDAALILGILPFVVFEFLAIDARARLHMSHPGVAPGLARRARSLQLRLFLSSFLPFLPIALLSTLIGLNETWSVRLEEVGLLGAALAVVILLGAAIFLPRLILLAWDTAPLEASELRTRLEDLARRGGFRFSGLGVWRTGGLMANAVIVGFTPASRTVLFTDALLGKMRPEELEAVFAHEMGHAKRHHGMTMAAFFLAVLLGCELLAESLAPRLGGDHSPIGLGISVLGISLGAFLFGRVSRAMELEADLESFRAIGDVQPLASTLFKITDPAAYGRSSWRHPSTARRIRFLLDVERDSEVGRRLQRRLRNFMRAAFTAFVLMVVWQLCAYQKTWAEDWVVVDLRLGAYASAGARLDAGADVSERLRELVQLSVTLDAREAEPAALVLAGRRALEGGEWQRALDLVQLAFLRGHAGTGPLLDSLGALLAGEALPEHELGDEWTRAFDSLVSGRGSSPGTVDPEGARRAQ